MVDLLGRGGESGQVETDPADQRLSISFRRRLDAFLLQARQDEVVDRIANPACVVDPWRLGLLDSLKSPVTSARLGGARNVRLLPRQPHFHPTGQSVDLRLLQLARRRHLQIAAVPNCLDQQAVFRVARRNCGPTHAALQRALPSAERKPAHLRCVVVTEQALRVQHWPHLFLEEPRLLRRQILSGQRAEEGERGDCR